MFNIHPVLALKNGELTLKSIGIGKYEKAYLRYIRRELKKPDKIDKKRAFITYAGCNVKMLKRIRDEVNDRCCFEKLIQTKTSTTISSNCGPGTFGVLFIRKQ